MLSFDDFMKRLQGLTEEILGLKAEGEAAIRTEREAKDELISVAKIEELRSGINKT